MAKRAITTFTKNPCVRFTGKEGSKFVGKLVGTRETKWGLAFQSNAIEGDAPIQTKTDKDAEWTDVDIEENAIVDVLTSKDGQLETKMKQVKAGEVFEIVFKGKVLNPKTGRRYNDYEVSVIE